MSATWGVPFVWSRRRVARVAETGLVKESCQDWLLVETSAELLPTAVSASFFQVTVAETEPVEAVLVPAKR